MSKENLQVREILAKHFDKLLSSQDTLELLHTINYPKFTRK
jgi:hypothetical protein